MVVPERGEASKILIIAVGFSSCRVGGEVLLPSNLFRCYSDPYRQLMENQSDADQGKTTNA